MPKLLSSPPRLFLAFIACGLLLVGHGTIAEEPASDSVDKDYAAELPRIAALEPAQALASFQTRPGFHLELVAAEPLVNSPVAAAYDEDGRLYVVEMRGYSENQDDKISRVRRLEDADGDGRYDRASVFIDGLRWPTAVACYGGGVFIGDAPDIFFARDADGDGQAEFKKTVFSGFGTSNVQGLLNSFQWGPDNRIYGSASSTGGEIETLCNARELWGGQEPESDPFDDGKPISLRGRDFSFDPRTLELRPESGGAQHGMCFDNWGTRYVCSNSDHIQQVMYDETDIARNALLPAPGARQSIAADGAQAEVFRTSQVEPWRVVRTRLRVAGIVPGPVEGGGRAAGYFTSATGVTIYRGDALPADMRGNAFIGDVGSNIIHRKLVETGAIEHVARRADAGVEFITSTDVWFRPCQFVNAPDGSLQILDVYREVIEHPASLPPVIKKHLDLTNGRDRGRIYRLVPDGFQSRPAPRLSKAETAELVMLLEHANGWHVDTAARLLYERHDPTAIPLLKKLIAESKTPTARMRALYALSGLAALDELALLTALDDADAGVRRHAVRLSDPTPAVAAKLARLVDDPDIHVRYQLAFALGKLDEGAKVPALVALARRDGGDRWMRVAMQSSLAEQGVFVATRLLADSAFRNDAARRAFLVALVEQEAARAAPGAGEILVRALADLPADDDGAAACLIAYREALRRRGLALDDVLTQPAVLALASARIAATVAAARHTAADESLAVDRRAAAIAALGLSSFGEVRDALVGLMASNQPPPLQSAAARVLARYDDPDVATVILAAWPGLGPRQRAETADALFSRKAWVLALLAAIDAKSVAVGDFDPARLRELNKHADDEVRQRAAQVLGAMQLARRQDVVDAYQSGLTMTGDVERGRGVFRKVCAACHKAEGVGQELGPNLATVQNRGTDAILLNVLDPNREANPQFVNYTLITTDGRSLTGMLTAETATSVTLTRAEGASDTVLRSEIEELRSTGLSLMPEGLEQQIDKQAMADLIAYLMTLM